MQIPLPFFGKGIYFRYFLKIFLWSKPFPLSRDFISESFLKAEPLPFGAYCANNSKILPWVIHTIISYMYKRGTSDE